MEYEKSKYTRSKIEKAGKIISEYNEDSKEFNEFLPVVDNWRAAHAYPLDVIASIVNEEIGLYNQENQNRIQNDIKIVKRIKRLDSIVGKLKRTQNAGLYRMQDLGGCRIIVHQLNDVYDMAERIRCRLEKEGHIVDRIDDYISKPRIKTGYRSYHIRVKFCEESTYNGMYIEIQIRTEQEHIWATSIEIMDASTNDTLKAETGNTDYMYYFKLISALFSLEEETTIVEGVPTTKKEIMEELNQIEKKLSLRRMLAARNNALRITDHAPVDAAYYLLITDFRRSQISISTFTQTEITDAIKEYERYEKTRRSEATDAVLVSAKNFDTIRECYPNYFMNTNLFLAKIRDYFIEYSSNNGFLSRGNVVKISEIFTVQHYKPNIPKTIKIWEGIGQTDGDLIFCSDGAAIMEDRYMRFSAICMKSELLPMDEIGKPYEIKGPAIVAMATGACFYVEHDFARMINEVDCIVIQCKEGVSTDQLLYFLGWSKSNIFVWDLYNNYQSNSIYNKDVFEKIEMPKPVDKLLRGICDSVELIIRLEEEFINEFCRMKEDSGDVEQIYVDDFNNKISELLVNNEHLFGEYLNLSEEVLDDMYDDLNQKGFYVYR